MQRLKSGPDDNLNVRSAPTLPKELEKAFAQTKDQLLTLRD